MNDVDHAGLVEGSTRRMVAGFDAMVREDWRGAAAHFLFAAEMRDRLPWRDGGEPAWMVAAAWLNHGDMLMRTGEAGVRKEALVSFDRTIDAMNRLPLEQNPAYVERLLLAWLNRAAACGDEGDTGGAMTAFSEAKSLLEAWGKDVTPARSFMAAMLRVNRARVLMAADRHLEAWQDVREGIRILRLLDLTLETARAGIQARSVQCRALAMLLDEPGGPERVGDWIAEATDSAEEALALVRATGFRDDWIPDLVRYGARIYQACQPQFLGEFVTEWLAGDGPLSADEALKQEMKNLLRVALLDAERKVLQVPHETEFVGKQTRVVKALQAGLKALG